MKFSLLTDALDKAMADLAFHDVAERLKRIGWDLKSLLSKPISVKVFNSAVGDDIEIRMFACLNNDKVLSFTALVSHMALLTRSTSVEVAELLSLETKAAASQMFGAVLEAYDTTYDAEMKKIIEARDKAYNNSSYIQSDPSVLCHSDYTVARFDTDKAIRLFNTIEERKKNAKWKIE